MGVGRALDGGGVAEDNVLAVVLLEDGGLEQVLEVVEAEAVLDEATRQPGVFRFRGRMIDEPVLRQARRVLSR